MALFLSTKYPPLDNPLQTKSWEVYKILSPVFKLCCDISNESVLMFTTVEVNPIGLTNNLSYTWFYFNFTLKEVQIPTDVFGFTVNWILSP